MKPLNSEDSKKDEDEAQKDMAYKLHLKAVMQQLETFVFNKNNQVNAQY